MEQTKHELVVDRCSPRARLSKGQRGVSAAACNAVKECASLACVLLVFDVHWVDYLEG